MKVKVLFFALCREITGEESVEFEIEAKASVKTLVDAVVKKFPKMAPLMANMVLSVNLEYVDPKSTTVMIGEKDEIAFIPPISGG
mmetsp:Transcript_2382/g.3444  ORF Transcript_2382/g.3444 Transcript_2382/m.3444 type:complete len:85 (-) Transcript_2382:213-467(-)